MKAVLWVLGRPALVIAAIAAAFALVFAHAALTR